jgi:hypothetical protein
MDPSEGDKWRMDPSEGDKWRMDPSEGDTWMDPFELILYFP